MQGSTRFARVRMRAGPHLICMVAKAGAMPFRTALYTSSFVVREIRLLECPPGLSSCTSTSTRLSVVPDHSRSKAALGWQCCKHKLECCGVTQSLRGPRGPLKEQLLPVGSLQELLSRRLSYDPPQRAFELGKLLTRSIFCRAFAFLSSRSVRCMISVARTGSERPINCRGRQIHAWDLLQEP